MARIFMAMNGKRINTLDELRENFNSAQMISFYRGGRLQKWLEEIGASEELENIQSFEDGYDDDTLLSMLMAVFELSDEQIAKIKKTEKPSKQNKEGVVHTSEYVAEETNKQTSASSSEKDCHWFLGRMNSQIYKNGGDVNCEAIDENALCDINDPIGNDDLSIERIFFFDGHFIAALNVYGDDDTNDAILQSYDLKHWTPNAVMSDLGYDFLSSSNGIIFGDEHCFVFSTSKFVDDKALFIGSSVSEWRKIDLFLPGCEIVGIFEKNKTIGIFYSSSEKSGILLADSIFALSKRKFKDIELPKGVSSVGISSCFIFKNYCFYWRGARFFFADMDNWNFEPVKCDWGSLDKSWFSFNDIVFIVVRPYNANDSWGVYCSIDGVTWNEIEFDFDGIPPAKIYKLGNVYYALSETNGGYCKLFYSTNGTDWTLRTKICCSGYSIIGETGNGNIVLTTGVDEYLFCSVY